MRSAMRVAALLSVVPFLFSVSACAERIDFHLSGFTGGLAPFQIAFSLDPSIYVPAGNFLEGAVFEYDAVATRLGSSRQSSTLYFNPHPEFGEEFLELYGADLDAFFTITPTDGALPLTGEAEGLPPTITPESYRALLVCTFTLRMPERAPGAMTTLALVETPVPAPSCGLGGTLLVTTPATSVTPEPSTIGLLGTGALGLIGLVRRRSQKSTRYTEGHAVAEGCSQQQRAAELWS